MEYNKKSLETKIRKLVGYIFLSPPIIGVFLFLFRITGLNNFKIVQNMENLDWGMRGNFDGWSGGAYSIFNAGTAGFTSPIPLYFGLMAVAGAYLIKDK